MQMREGSARCCLLCVAKREAGMAGIASCAYLLNIIRHYPQHLLLSSYIFFMAAFPR